jgi:hypothetical protein
VISKHRTEGKDTMITQRIKNWLRRVFSWRQTSQIEYRHISSTLSAVAPSEGLMRSAMEGNTPQVSTTSTTGAANATPFLSPLEERPAPTALTPSPPGDDPAKPHLPSSNLTRASEETPTPPTPQQRLEFLRYLVKQGIVNEGKEE